MKTETIIAAAAGLAVGYFAFRKTDAAVGASIGNVANKIFVRYLIKEVVEDDYNEGEVGKRQTVITDNNVGMFNGTDLLSSLSKRYGLDYSDKSKWTAFEDGRIIYSQLEDEDGMEPSKLEIEQWKRGQKKLWRADYDIYVDKVKTAPASLKYLVDTLKIKQY